MYFDIDSLTRIESKNDACVAVYGRNDDLKDLYEEFDESIVNEVFAHSGIRYEDHLGYDVICLTRKPYADENQDENIYVFVKSNSIYLVGDSNYLESFINAVTVTMRQRKKSVGTILYHFLLMLSNDFHEVTNSIESEISVLEDEILDGFKETKNYSKRILHYRKHLLARNRTHEQFNDIIDYLLINNNEIYNEIELSRFKILKDRINRLQSQVSSMLEYVTEVREAYQSSVDARQNKIMSLFTVITSIFLPLTLIVGWYGMNFKMPEFESELSYPIVIVLSVCIVVFCIYYFKKKKWF